MIKINKGLWQKVTVIYNFCKKCAWIRIIIKLKKAKSNYLFIHQNTKWNLVNSVEIESDQKVIKRQSI